MRQSLEVDGIPVEVDLRGAEGQFDVFMGEQSLRADACWTGAQSISLLLDGHSHDVDIVPRGGNVLEVFIGGRSLRVQLPTQELALWSGQKKRAAAGLVVATMPGKVVAVLVADGDTVSEGQGVVVVEAMKMENEMQAPIRGRVKSVKVKPGQIVDGGTPLVDIESC